MPSNVVGNTFRESAIRYRSPSVKKGLLLRRFDSLIPFVFTRLPSPQIPFIVWVGSGAS
jgi:hypothetical protein